MRRSTKPTAARSRLRKAPESTPVPRRAPAPWIDAEDGLAFTANVTRRVRVALPLRAVRAKRLPRSDKGPHARGHA